MWLASRDLLSPSGWHSSHLLVRLQVEVWLASRDLLSPSSWHSSHLLFFFFFLWSLGLRAAGTAAEATAAAAAARTAGSSHLLVRCLSWSLSSGFLFPDLISKIPENTEMGGDILGNLNV